MSLNRKKHYHEKYDKHKKIYESYEMYSKDNVFLCYCNKRKAKFYIDKIKAANWIDNNGNLIKEDMLDTNSSFPIGDAMYKNQALNKFKLNFNSKSENDLPYRKRMNDPYYYQDLNNRCVCCGTSEYLTKHHVIPYMYRKHFHDKFKNNNHHDVLLLCYECHRIYELEADKYKEYIANKLNIPKNLEGIKSNIEKQNERIFKSRDLLNKCFSFDKDGFPLVNLPPDRLLEVTKQAMKNLIVLNPRTNDSIERYCMTQKTTGELVVGQAAKLSKIISKSKKENPNLIKKYKGQRFGNYIKYLNENNYIDEIKEIESNLYKFVFSWRKHFIDTAKPRFMPKFWCIEKKYD